MCEYCREGIGKSILHDNDFEFLNIFIMNGMLWEKSMDMGIEINYCPMCRTKIGRRWTKGGRAMTKEQEAIENLTDLLKQRNEKQVQITTYNLFENIETILSMLKEKDEKIEKVLELIFQYGQTDGEHHKAWIIDQVVRILTGEKYKEWIKEYIYDEETGESYSWYKGIAP